MNYLSIENLGKSYDEKLLFEDITFGLELGRKAALVGVNGCGKSTLLRLIAGLDTPDTGEISMRKGITVSMLMQNPVFDDEASISEAIFTGDSEVLNAIRDYELALLESEENPDIQKDLTPLIERLDALSGWDYEYKVHELLGKLGIHHVDKKIKELSGGQKKRVALAQVLITDPDLLILDEPTNHLDLEVIEWLEDYLSAQNLTLLMVTHDRYFLDKVTNEILEVEGGQIFRYSGNYSYFLEKKEERFEQESASVDKARNLLRKELEWMRRQPKARGTKAKYRIDAFYETKEKASKKLTGKELEVNLGTRRQGKKILELDHISKSFENRSVVGDFSYVFKRMDRIGIVGPNGVGKSTLLNIITKAIKPDTGNIDLGQTTVHGYYTQEEAHFDPRKKVIDIVREVAEFIKLADGNQISASQLLNQFLFPPKMQHNFVGKLSGGELRRLQLLRVLMANPNFLILDEPTNDLDITTLNVLENYLESFEGCLLIVSHDRYFMDKLVDHLFVFEGEGIIRDFPGNYTDYRNRPSEKKESVQKEVKTEEVPVTIERERKLTYNEKREFDQLEKEIPKLDKRKREIESKLAGDIPYDELMRLTGEFEEVKAQIEEKEMRWLELSELS